MYLTLSAVRAGTALKIAHLPATATAALGPGFVQRVIVQFAGAWPPKGMPADVISSTWALSR